MDRLMFLNPILGCAAGGPAYLAQDLERIDATLSIVAAKPTRSASMDLLAWREPSSTRRRSYDLQLSTPFSMQRAGVGATRGWKSGSSSRRMR